MPQTEPPGGGTMSRTCASSIERRRADEVGAGRRRRERAKAADLADEAFLRGPTATRRRRSRDAQAPGSGAPTARVHFDAGIHPRDGHRRAPTSVASASCRPPSPTTTPFSERALTPPARRRTVEITGRPSARPRSRASSRSTAAAPPRSGTASASATGPTGSRSGRSSSAFFLILVAATSASHAATPHGAPAHAAATRGCGRSPPPASPAVRATYGGPPFAIATQSPRPSPRVPGEPEVSR